MAEREYLLGVCEKNLGNLQAAKAHLGCAAELGEAEGARALVVRSQSELAEIEWRYGDEETRAIAIQGFAQP